MTNYRVAANETEKKEKRLLNKAKNGRLTGRGNKIATRDPLLRMFT